jgi:hypothetical protein
MISAPVLQKCHTFCTFFRVVRMSRRSIFGFWTTISTREVTFHCSHHWKEARAMPIYRAPAGAILFVVLTVEPSLQYLSVFLRIYRSFDPLALLVCRCESPPQAVQASFHHLKNSLVRQWTTAASCHWWRRFCFVHRPYCFSQVCTSSKDVRMRLVDVQKLRNIILSGFRRQNM